MNSIRNEYIKQWLFKAKEDLLVVNTLIAHNARYPGDIYLPSKEEMLIYKEIVLKIKEIVENRLKQQ